MDYNVFEFFKAAGNQTENSSSVVLEISPLPIRRLLNVTVFAHYCDNHPLTSEIEVGMFIASVIGRIKTI